ncbi:NUDIX hydrolase domain-like protein [Neocallimastix sp. 'constans']|jgi:diphosphoinositol-polyphosphate diphosphatase
MTQIDTIPKDIVDYASEARSGREKQVYNDVGAREVAGCVPIDPKTGKVLLISCRKKPNCWIFPKGGWENDETVTSAAMRETWEEAGVKGEIVSMIGKFKQYKKFKKNTCKKNPSIDETNENERKYLHSEVLLYEMKVTEIADDWPEKNERERCWVSYDEAKNLIKKTAYVDEALDRSSIAH